MRIQELLSRLNRQGIRLEVVDNNLKINAPKGKLTPALVKRLREKKQEIITFLQSHARDREKYSLVEAVEKKEYYPLSSAQKRIYIIQRMDLDVIAYNMPLFLELFGEFDKDKFTGAFRRLIARHESLRTSFHIVDDEPVQKINEEVEFKVEEEEQATDYGGQETGGKLVSGHISNDCKITARRAIKSFDQTFSKVWPPAGPPEATRQSMVEETPATHLSSSDVICRLSSEFVRPFDLTRAPLLRVGLIEIGKQGHILMVDTHHIVADGVSRGIFIKDFISLYQGEELPRLPVQYKDFTGWQNREKHKDGMKSQEEYWLKEFNDEIPVLNLPLDFVRPPEKNFEGSTVDFEINPGETKEIKKLAREEDATLFMVLLAIYNIFLSKISGQEDIVIGAPISGRGHSDLRRIIGMFVNTLALRNAPNGTKSFKEFLEQLSERTLDAFENRDYQFEDLVEQVAVQREANRNPLFETMFSMENMEIAEIKIPGLNLKTYDYQNVSAKFDLMLTAVEAGENLQFAFEYCNGLFKEETVLRFTGFFHKIISTVLENCDIRISGIEIINEEEKNRILHEFNDTEAEYPRDKTIHQLFAEQVKKRPDNIAVIGEMQSAVRKAQILERNKERHAPCAMRCALTYRELNNQCHRLAHILTGKGVKPDIIVAIMVERSIEMIMGILGILKAGGAYLPIDPEYPEERIKYMLKDSGAKILLTMPELDTALEPSLSTLTSTSTCQVSPRNLAYIIYTSGTTGQSKGTLIEHENVVRLLFNDKFPFDFGTLDIWTMFHSYCFDFSVWEMYGALLYGGILIIIPKMISKDPQRYLEILDKEGVTVLNQTPSVFYNLVNEALNHWNREIKLAIKYVIFGGEMLKPTKLKKWKEKYPGVKIINMFGITETTVHVTYKEIGDKEIKNNISNIGKPIPTLTTYVLDKNLNPLPIGVAGELCVGGKGVARGYLNRPELTREKFVRTVINHPSLVIKNFKRSVNSHLSLVTGSSSKNSDNSSDLFPNDQCLMTNERTSKLFPNDQYPMTNDRLYKSGDLARFLENGDLEYLGRIDHQVKIRGFRIELGEIENRLLTHEKVKEAIVIAREDNNDKSLCAYMVAKTGETNPIDQSGLREHLANHLPDYMVPSYFVQLDNIPLTPNGKVDRKALPQPEMKTGKNYIAPRNEIEKKLVYLWSEILNVEREKIGIHDNFFHLGGHSLKATVLVSRIHKELNINVSLSGIFKAPRIRELAKYIKSLTNDRYESIQPVEKKDYYRVSSTQKRLYILQQMESGHTTSYNMPYVIPLVKEIEKEQLASAFKKLIARHESLRTSFQSVSGEPFQRIHDSVNFAIRDFDLEKESKNVEEIIANFESPFDLSRAPLLRVGLIRLPHTPTGLYKRPSQTRIGNKYLLLVDMHHIITDGASQNILEQEFWALAAGQELSPFRLHYKDFSGWQNSRERKETIIQQETFWKEEFSHDDQLTVLNLPTDYPRPSVQSFEGSSVQFVLTPRETRSLKDIAKETDLTLFMCLLSIYTILLAKLSGQEDIIVGIPIAARRHADTEHIIGMFANTLAMRNYPSGEKTLREFLQEVKVRTIKAFENQEYPFEELVERVPVHRDISRNPIFDVMFNLLNRSELNAAADMPTVDGQDAHQYEYQRRTAKFDLNLTAVDDNGKNLYFDLEYCTRLFKASTIERMIGYFRRIVVLLSVNPGLKISELEIITEEEKTRVLEMSNGVEEESYAAQTIHRSFEDQVEKSPNSIALVGISHQAQSTTQRLVLYSAISFKELNEKSNRLASVLIERGVTTDTIVGLMVERSVEMIAAILAILKAGGAYLPIDKEYPEKRKRFMLKDSRIKLLLTYHDSEPLPGAPTGEIEILDISDEGIYSRYNSNSKPMSIGTNLLYVIYTSGTTGKPKGVMLEHKNLVNLVSHQYQYTNIDFSRVLQFTTISFDVSAQEIFSTLLAGGQLSIIDKETRNNVTDLFKIVERDEIKTLFLATAFLKFIFKEKDYVGLIPASVKHIVAAGEQLIIGDNLKKYLKANQVYLHNHYGPSETHVVTALTLEPPEEIPDIPSIGKPILNTSIFILDKKQCLLPIGVSGEMYISGIQVGRGYLDRPQLTAERFNRIVIRHSSVVDSSSKFSPNEQCPMPNDRLYKTGDLVRWLPDGNIEFLGRMDDQVKIRGFRVELGEVESQLLTHDEITEAVVVLREEKQGYPPYLCGYFVSNRNISSPELREYLLKTLPDYMIPTYFVQVDKIPITPNGKIDRKTLPAPELKAGENYVAPGNKVEKKLVEIWSEVLGIEKEKISMNDNFFHLGGHSLKATILISKLHRSLNIKLPLTEFFKRPTIEEISHYIKHIKGAARNKYTGLDIIEEREYYELSSAQKRLFILDQTEGAINTAYNLPVAMLIEGEFIRQRVEDSFNTLVTRHDSFRTSFDIKGGKPVQIIHDTVVFKIKYSTLENGHPGNKSLDPEKANELNQIVKDFIKPFELGKAPLLKASLTCLGSKKHLLLFDMHHIISDGFSTGVLVKEFLHLYEGKALPQLKLQYKDFTGWQNKLLNSEEMKKQEDYWLNRFRGDIPILNMPTDYPRQPVKNFEGNTVSWEIDRELTGKISEVMEETGTTLYMILLAIFNILLSKYTGQEDIIVGVPAAARSHPDLENIIGMFVNTLAMRNYPGKERSFDDFLQEVKENALKAFENQDYPFEELVNKLEISKDYSRNPLFDVLFVSEKLEIPGLELRGLTFTPFEIENKISHMDLVLYIVEENDTIVLRLEYDSDLFKGSSAEEMLKHYVDILEQAVKYRSIQLEEIDISQDLLVAQANIVKENLEDFGF